MSVGTHRSLLTLDPSVFTDHFDRGPFMMGHDLSRDPRFELPALVELSKRLPETSVEYNAGNLPVGVHPKATPQTGLSVTDTIQRIDECRSWMVLKNVEQDPEYGQLLGRCLAEVRALSEALDPGMCDEEAFIFISSPGSVTPYHIDVEHNFLLQVRGTKNISVFDRSDRSLLAEADLEGFFTGAHRNLPFSDEFQHKAQTFTLGPGDGVHVPVVCPHWVKNGEAVSISFSITFRTPRLNRQAAIYAMNARMRNWRLNPTEYGRSALTDSVKYLTYRAVRKLEEKAGVGRKDPDMTQAHAVVRA